jgi:hypothetical protein
MATIADYWEIAKNVYAQKAAGAPMVAGWERQKWEWGTWYGDGFQGGVFESEQELIVGFSGTKGGLLSAPISQNSANARIALNVIPNMAGSAKSMVDWAKERGGGVKPVSIVGHSLGGGLAQVIGNWSGCPFISLNGPGMASQLKMSAFNIFKPVQMYRSASSGATGDTVGICFTVKGDLIGEFGYHVGTEFVRPYSGNDPKHGLDALWTAIGNEMLQQSPRDILSIWPAPPAGRGRR